MAHTDLQTLINKAMLDTPHVAVEPYDIHDFPLLEGAHRARLLRELEARDSGLNQTPNRVHIGVAGFFNFDIAAITRPAGMLLMDVNPHQRVFWGDVIALLAEHGDAASFRAAYEARKQADGYHTADGALLPLPQQDDFNGYLDHAQWIQDPEAYTHLHMLAKDGKIATAIVNLLEDPARAEAIGNAVREAGYVTDTAYWSNIASMLAPFRAGRFISKADSVYGDMDHPMAAPGVKMPVEGYRPHEPREVRTWTSDSIRAAAVHAPNMLPGYEKFMRNVSGVAGKQGTNYFLDVMPMKPLLVHEGNPRRLPQQEREWRERMKADEQFKEQGGGAAVLA